MSRLPSLGPRGEGWVAGQFVLFAAIILAGWATGLPLSQPALDIVRVSGAALLLSGIALIGIGALQLDRSLSVLPRPVNSGVHVDRGLYRWVRHPIYVGVIVAALGGSVYTASPLAGVLTLLLAIWLDLKARREEAWLRERYPTYAEYITRTRKFIPGIY